MNRRLPYSKIDKPPIEGYRSIKALDPNKTNLLEYKPSNKKSNLITLILLFITLCIGFCGGFYVADKINERASKNEKKADNVKSLQLVGEPSIPEGKYETHQKEAENTPPAISYLDNNDVWSRNEMENYPATQKLWDALNERRFDDILQYETNLASNKFCEVIKAVKDNKHKTFQQNYNTKANDYKITIDDYIQKLYNAIDPNKTDKTKSSKATNSSKESKKDNSKNKPNQNDF